MKTNASNTKKRYHLRGRIWIEDDTGTFLGYGRVILLEKIKEYGSISAAARSMNMSYRHAWKLVDAMNRHSESPVVEKVTGGKGGGGAAITDSGQQAIDLFWEVSDAMQDFLDEGSKKFLS